MLTPKIDITPAAEKFIGRMVRFSEHPAGGFRLTVGVIVGGIVPGPKLGKLLGISRVSARRCGWW